MLEGNQFFCGNPPSLCVTKNKAKNNQSYFLTISITEVSCGAVMAKVRPLKMFSINRRRKKRTGTISLVKDRVLNTYLEFFSLIFLQDWINLLFTPTTCLTHFSPIFRFYTPWNCQKAFDSETYTMLCLLTHFVWMFQFFNVF